MPTSKESEEILEERLQEIVRSHRAADERIIADMQHKVKISEEKVKILESKVMDLERKLKK